MRRSKLWLKAFALTIMAALGLMAFTAVAQAEKLANGGKEAVFLVNKGSALLATLTGTSEGQVRILEPGRNLTIRCNSLDFSEGKINSATEALVKIVYLECVALLLSNESEEIGCTPVGGAITTALRALPKTHEGKPFILLEGDPTTNIGVIEYESGTECPLPLKSPISGTVIGEVTAAEGGGQLLQFNNTIRELFNDKINYGAFQLILDASMVLELTGAHKGMSLGIF